MPERGCLSCGASLDGEDRRAKLCSDACRDVWNKEKMRQWRKDHREHLKTFEKERRKHHSEQARARYAKDGERINAVSRARKRRNAQKINEQQRARYVENCAARELMKEMGVFEAGREP